MGGSGPRTALRSLEKTNQTLSRLPSWHLHTTSHPPQSCGRLHYFKNAVKRELKGYHHVADERSVYALEQLPRQYHKSFCILITCKPVLRASLRLPSCQPRQNRALPIVVKSTAPRFNNDLLRCASQSHPSLFLVLRHVPPTETAGESVPNTEGLLESVEDPEPQREEEVLESEADAPERSKGQAVAALDEHPPNRAIELFVSMGDQRWT